MSSAPVPRCGEMAAVRLVVVLLGLCEAHVPHSYQYVRREFETFFIEDEADRWMCLIFGVCLVPPIQPIQPHKQGLSLVYQWSQLEFEYKSAKDRQNDIDRNNFIPGKPTPIDVDVHYSHSSNKRNRVFVTVPRFQPGVPVTLGTVTDTQLNGNPIIRPFPSWDWHRNPNQCKRDRLVSVFRVAIDECQRLWVLDTGKVLEQQVCPAQILAFDLQTNQLLHRYEIPSTLMESRSILVTPVVDVRDAHGSCTDTFVYVADCQTYSIIVYDVRNERSWRATDKTMYPYPNYGTFAIQGESFDLMDGVLGMALSPFRPGTDRKLFYHAMSSPTENWVYTSELRNRSRFLNDSSSSPDIFHTYAGERRTQSAAEAIDKDGTMYFGLMSDVTLDCWNTATDYGASSIEAIERNRQTLQFASGVKVATVTADSQELWVLTSRFQKVMTGSLDSDEVNFRIQAGSIEDLTVGTRCKGGRRPQAQTGGGGYGLLKPSNGYGGRGQNAISKQN